MDAWMESVMVAVAVGVIGIVALGPRFELWRTAPAIPVQSTCVALHGDTFDHRPRCANPGPYGVRGSTTRVVAAGTLFDD
jgi:hypothetical protein